MIGLPPFEGADHETVTLPSPGTTPGAVGIPGTVAAAVGVADTAAEKVVPALFFAPTRN